MPPAHRVCIFLPSLAGGGAERVMVTLANGFTARGRDVFMVLAEGSGPFRNDLDASVKVEILGCRHTILSASKFAAFLRRCNPDIVLSALIHANIASVLACKSVPNLKAILSERNSVNKTLLRKGILFRAIYRVLINRYYAKSHSIICVSDGVARELSEWKCLKAARFRTIYNPIDIAEIRRRSTETTETSPHSHPDLPLVVACGRLVPLKRFDMLLKSFRALLDQTPCNLSIIGEGPERDNLERTVEELALTNHVRLPGFLKNPFPLIGRASAFALSSNHEGLPGVLIEAMALGTPVVSTDCPHGPREILEGGRWGRLVPIGDPDALAAAFLDTLRAPPVAPEALMARADAFDKEHAIDAYLTLLDDAASAAKQSR